MLRSPRRRPVLILVLAQALFQSASIMVMAFGGLAGTQLASDQRFATLPIAMNILGTALTIAPASMIMERYGRRTGFVSGALSGVLGGLVASCGIWIGSLWLLAAGTGLIGVYAGFAQFYRFAAAEIVGEEFRPRAISFVLAGGVVAAVAGPELGRLGGQLMMPEYFGTFVILSTLAAIAAGALAYLKVPPPVLVRPSSDTPRTLRSIMLQPPYAVALFGAATGYGVMILAMTATPLAMVAHHHSIADTSRVIEAHVLGMFVPSFFTGCLVTRLGVVPVMLAGAAILCGHIAMVLSGTGFYSFMAALILLGIGWNFLYIGGTTLLTRTYTPAEKGRAQAANDLVIFSVGVLSSSLSAVLLDRLGWQMMNVALLPWLIIAIGMLLWISPRHTQTFISQDAGIEILHKGPSQT